MSNDPKILVAWETLKQGQCAYKGGLIPRKITCNHLYSLTSTCGFSDCPIVQPNYISLQRHETTLFLLEKKAGQAISEQWSEEELEGDQESMKQIITNKSKVMAPKLQQAILERYDILTNLIEDLRSGFGTEGDEEEAED